MRWIGAGFVAALLALAPSAPSHAASEGFVVASCPGTLANPWPVGQFGSITVDINGIQCTSGSGGGGGGAVNVTQWNTVAVGSPTAYGTAPTGNAPGVNAFVTNANTNGQKTMANSSPVVIASDQPTLSVLVTNGIATATPLGAPVVNNTTAIVVKASPGTVYSIQLGGIGSAPAYLKLYDATSATCGSGTPKKRLIIPAASTAANGAGSNVAFPVGITFATGITYCVTTGITDADTTAPAASTYLVNVDFN